MVSINFIIVFFFTIIKCLFIINRRTMGQRESTQGIKRKREEDESNNEQEKSNIINKITSEFSQNNKPGFIEKSLIVNCKEEQNLYILIGEVHPSIKNLKSQAQDAAQFVNSISEAIKNRNKNVSIFLLTERSTCGTDFSKYWNKIHEDLSSNLYSDIISCDIRNEFLVCEAMRLLSELMNYNELGNSELYINKFFVLVEKHKEMFRVTREIIGNPENIFNYPPLQNKDFDEQTRTKIINMINNILNYKVKERQYRDILNYKVKERQYREILNEIINEVEQMTIRDFLKNSAIQMLNIEENEDNTSIKQKLVKHAVDMEIVLKKNVFDWFDNEIFDYQTFDDREYLTKLYGVIMDAEVMYQIQTIKNSEKDKKLKVIMIYAGSEHINVYENNLFSKLICDKEEIIR